MEPMISNINISGNQANFTLTNVNVSIANSLRRTIMSEIPVIVFKTTPDNENLATITKNTSRMNNEIVKQRLSCIPIVIDDMDFPIDTYILEVNETNASDSMFIVTTEHFKIKNIQNDQYLSREKTKVIFPPDPITRQYIDFVRLRPKISDEIPGESIALTCKFSISSAKIDGMFNVTSTCVYGNTPDFERIAQSWAEQESKLKASQIEVDALTIERENFMLMNAQRIFVDNSFDFTIDSIGIYDPIDLVIKSCDILVNKCETFMDEIRNKPELIQPSNTTMPNTFDVALEHEDYTLGKMLEYFLHVLYYEGDSKLSFCGFKKFHPHDPGSIIRLSYKSDESNDTIVDDLTQASKASIITIKKIREQFV